MSRHRKVLVVAVAGLLASILWLAAPHRSVALAVLTVALCGLLGALRQKALLAVLAASPYGLGTAAVLLGLLKYEVTGRYRLVAEDSNGTSMPSVALPVYMMCFRGVVSPAQVEPPSGILGFGYHVVRPTLVLYASFHNAAVAERLASRHLSKCPPNADWVSAWKRLEGVVEQQGRGWLALSQGDTPEIVIGTRHDVHVETFRPKTCEALARSGIATSQQFVLRTSLVGGGAADSNRVRWTCRDGHVVPTS